MISTGGEGKVSARKRLRGKIGDPSAHPELKQYNLVDASTGATLFYSSQLFYGIYVREESNAAGIWTPVPLRWPALSNSNSGRIGKRIRIKYLRLKGFIGSSPFLTNQVRYRLVLYRTRRNLVGTEEVYDQAWLASLYHKYYNMESYATNTGLIMNASVNNYYCSFFDPDALKAKDCKRRVLLKGIIKPSQDLGYYMWSANDPGYLRTVPTVGQNIDTITGQAAGSIQRGAQFQIGPAHDISVFGRRQKHNISGPIPSEVNCKAFFPIDVTVNMNDNVDCWEYRYVLVLESDWAIGQSDEGVYDIGQNVSNFILSLTPQIYFTDD